MARTITAPPAETLHRLLHPLTGAANDYDALLELIGDARLVLLGEASHGTHGFYRERARITRRLIEERGFTVVAVEAEQQELRVARMDQRLDADDADGLGHSILRRGRDGRRGG